MVCSQINRGLQKASTCIFPLYFVRWNLQITWPAYTQMYKQTIYTVEIKTLQDT